MCSSAMLHGSRTAAPAAMVIWQPNRQLGRARRSSRPARSSSKTASMGHFKTRLAAFAALTCLMHAAALPPGDWVFRPELSDEFEGDAINGSKWDTSPPSWGVWSWDAANVAVSGGMMHTTMRYKPHNVSLASLPACATANPNSQSATGCARGSASGSGSGNGSGGAGFGLGGSSRDHRGGVPVPVEQRTLYYTSGIATTGGRYKPGIAFGYFEARIRGAPLYPGVCPAFWAYRKGGDYWTELDFVEMEEGQTAAEQNRIDFTSHVFPPTDGLPAEVSNSTQTVFSFDPRADFHVYAHEWNRTDLTWYVDGNVVKHLPAEPYFNNSAWPMDVVISFGVRGALRTHPNSTGFPTTFATDYVRVWQRPEDVASF